MTETTPKPGPLNRALSLLRTGPRALVLRFIDQFQRKQTGAPVWFLSRITPHIYVGGQHRPRGWQAMQEEGITAVLNLREAHYDDATAGIGGQHHLHLPTRDNTPLTMEDLESAARFIAEQVTAEGKIYIHCGVGVGRAPTAAAAYFISQGMGADEAIRYMKQVRPFIHLTGGQMRQLRRFEARLRGPQAEDVSYEREIQA